MARKLTTFLKNLFSPSEGGKPDIILLVIVGVIIIFGLVMLLSASSIVSYNSYQDSYYFFKKQLFGLAMGIFCFWFFSRIDYHIWKKYAFLMLVSSVVLLLLVFIPGLSAKWGTAHSWINVFGFSLQPSELVKITFLLYLAAWLENRKHKLEEASQGLIPFLVVLGIISALLIKQPDLGTLSIIALTSLIIYFVGGGKVKHLIYIGLAGVLALFVLVRFNDYQANRFRCLVDPSFSANKYCYQVNQSLIAVGSGGFFGRGLGASRQKYLYLPEVSGDSIFPIIGEETGFIFSTVLVILFLLLFVRGYKIAKSTSDDFGRILAIGIVSWLTLQALVNIGGMINIMPMTGVPLPFVSYGGSAMMAALGAVGILYNISKNAKQ